MGAPKKAKVITASANNVLAALNAINADPTQHIVYTQQTPQPKAEVVITPEIKEYYKPTLDDFKLGLIYEQRWLNDWRESFLDEDHFDMSNGHCSFMVLLANLNQTKGAFYKIRFLDSTDILRLGFKRSTEDANVFTLQNCSITLNWESRFNITIKIDNDLIFRGQLLNSNELKTTLVTLGILVDQSRQFKFKQYGEEANKLKS